MQKGPPEALPQRKEPSLEELKGVFSNLKSKLTTPATMNIGASRMMTVEDKEVMLEARIEKGSIKLTCSNNSSKSFLYVSFYLREDGTVEQASDRSGTLGDIFPGMTSGQFILAAAEALENFRKLNSERIKPTEIREAPNPWRVRITSVLAFLKGE